MQAPTTRRLLELLAKYVERSAEPRPISIVLAEGLVAEGDTNTIDAGLELVETIEARQQRRGSTLSGVIAQALAEHRSDGLTLPFVLNPSSEYLVQGIAYVQPNDSDEKRAAKGRHAALFLNMQAELRGLGAYEFELLCAGVLRELGVRDAHHTRLSKDGGIDAFGLLPVGSFLDDHLVSSPTTKMRMWLICQAKRYVGSVAVGVVRELIGSAIVLRSLRRGSPSAPDGLDVRASDPVCLMVMTTGTFTRDAIDLLEETGVVGYDLDGLALFLSAKGVGLDDAVWSEAEFKAWLGRAAG